MVKGVLLDLGGVVYVGDTPLPGAVDAVARLRRAGLGLRFLTNTTRQPRASIHRKLVDMGLDVALEEVIAPASAARAYLKREGLGAHLLIDPALREDFAGVSSAEDGAPHAVVVGDAGRGFDYDSLNRAFRLLPNARAFLALAKNRHFRDADGELSLDAGPFVAALEYASERTATILGKPSPAFFDSAIAELGCSREEAVMIGDDVEADVAGALSAGLSAVLLRQGKYRAGDEDTIAPPPSALVDNLGEAADWILESAHEH